MQYTINCCQCSGVYRAWKIITWIPPACPQDKGLLNSPLWFWFSDVDAPEGDTIRVRFQVLGPLVTLTQWKIKPSEFACLELLYPPLIDRV